MKYMLCFFLFVFPLMSSAVTDKFNLTEDGSKTVRIWEVWRVIGAREAFFGAAIIKPKNGL
ncbi:hypothetical protein PspMM1_35880 [Pseudoalteromonas sp. MM1]|uniref:hypothetical protein n=1 Tax=Pseudoalteromonas sp. MM1 TaxID=3036714 RepID=UPI002573BA58|nr:hypothetical protein [Pseudoalteromonas sp. MM1]BED91120.1 hypothetical protein PspMM1_35880 [Pseudoalteromonas sp. MM1]